LFVTDDAGGDIGDLRSWELRITAEVDTGTVDEPVPANKAKKHKKKGKRRR
jgi:subtilisin-like proprotein convertase family protein